jgi:hypothetical protein
MERTTWNYSKAKADARVMIAAPDLLAACSRALNALRESYPNEDEGCGCEMCDTMRQLEKAIQKAKGE